MFKTLLFFVLLVSIASKNSEAQLTSGPVGWWKFDEASGSLAMDSSGNGSHGTLQSRAYLPQWFSGKFAGSLSFSERTQLVLVSTPAALNLTGNQFTLSAWINPTLSFFLDDHGTVISKGGSSAGYRLMVHKSGAVNLELGTLGAFRTLSVVPEGQWSHIVGVYDGSVASIYVNGVRDLKTLSVSGNLSHADNAVMLGGSATHGNMYSYHYNGLLDDVRVYNRALTSSEIFSLYNSGGGSSLVSPPVLSSLSAINIAANSAIISWNTNNPADSQVDFDERTPYRLSTIPESALVTTHSVSLVNLQPNTTYHYRVISRNAGGSRAMSSDLTFSTLPLVGVEPRISNGAPQGILAQNAGDTLLAVSTNVRATCKYGPNPNMTYDALPRSFTLTGDYLHTVMLTRLVNASAYTYYVRCLDSSGNKNSRDFVISFSVAATLSVGHGTTYSVKKDGTGQFSSIQACADQAAAGENCLVYPGNYLERVVTRRSGSADQYLGFKAQGTVVIKGFDINHNYIVVDGFEVTNSDNGACIQANDVPGIRISGDYDAVINNRVHDINSWGILAYSNSSSREALGGYVAHNRIDRPQSGLFIRGNNWVVEENEVIRPINYCSWADSDYSRFFGQTHTWRHNYYHGAVLSELGTAHMDCFQNYDNDGPLSVTNHILIKNNMCLDYMQAVEFEEFNLYKEKSGDFMLTGNVVARSVNPQTNTPIQVHIPHVSFINNTFAVMGAGVLGYGDVYGVGDLFGIIKNNIFSGFGPYNYSLPFDPTIREDFNLEIAKDGTSYLGTGFVRGIHDLTADPLFVNANDILGPDNLPFTSDDGLRLQINSPAKGAGENGIDLGGYAIQSTLPISLRAPQNLRRK